jgi:L-aspartate oxidase
LLEAVVCGGFVAQSIASVSPTRRRKIVCDLPPIGASDPAPARKIMTRNVGVLRDGEGLREAAGALLALARTNESASDAAIAGLMIAVAALRRKESRGAHARTDYPGVAAEPHRTALRLAEAIRSAEAFVPELID